MCKKRSRRRLSDAGTQVGFHLLQSPRRKFWRLVPKTTRRNVAKKILCRHPRLSFKATKSPKRPNQRRPTSGAAVCTLILQVSTRREGVRSALFTSRAPWDLTSTSFATNLSLASACPYARGLPNADICRVRRLFPPLDHLRHHRGIRRARHRCAISSRKTPLIVIRTHTIFRKRNGRIFRKKARVRCDREARTARRSRAGTFSKRPSSRPKNPNRVAV